MWSDIVSAVQYVELFYYSGTRLIQPLKGPIFKIFKTVFLEGTWFVSLFVGFLHPAVLIDDFSYIHNFIVILSWFITNQFNDLLPVGLLAQLVESCNGITEVKGPNPVKA